MDKREQILQATAALIAEHGLQNCPMAKVAQSAGCGAGTIYRYFETKEDLFKELFLNLYAKLEQRCLCDLSHCSSIKEQFFCFWGHFYNFMLENPTDMALLEQLRVYPGIDEMLRERATTKMHQAVHELLELGRQNGEIKPVHDDLLITMTFGSLLNLAKQSHLAHELDHTPCLAGVLEMCWDAISVHA